MAATSTASELSGMWSLSPAPSDEEDAHLEGVRRHASHTRASGASEARASGASEARASQASASEPRNAPPIEAHLDDSRPVGIALGDSGRAIVVYEVEVGLQGHAQGVRPGSVLLSINGSSTRGMDAAEAKARVASARGAGRPLRMRFAPPSSDRRGS